MKNYTVTRMVNDLGRNKTTRGWMDDSGWRAPERLHAWTIEAPQLERVLTNRTPSASCWDTISAKCVPRDGNYGKLNVTTHTETNNQ